MLIVKIDVNLNQVDEVGIVNTGRKENGLYLYRISHPEEYKEQFNHIEIWHNQKDPWPILVGKVMEVLASEPEWFAKRREMEESIKEEKFIEFLLKKTSLNPL